MWYRRETIWESSCFSMNQFPFDLSTCILNSSTLFFHYPFAVCEQDVAYNMGQWMFLPAFYSILPLPIFCVRARDFAYNMGQFSKFDLHTHQILVISHCKSTFASSTPGGSVWKSRNLIPSQANKLRLYLMHAHLRMRFNIPSPICPMDFSPKPQVMLQKRTNLVWDVYLSHICYESVHNLIHS